MTSSAPTPVPLKVLVEDLTSGATTEHIFKRSPVRVGRNALNELTLSAPFVSLSHAVVRFDAERTEVIDLGSTNGLLVDGKRIEPNVPVVVTPVSDVRIGSLRLHLGRSQVPGVAVAREMTHFRRATEQIRLTPGPHGIRIPPELRTPAPPTTQTPAARSFELASPATPALRTAAPPVAAAPKASSASSPSAAKVVPLSPPAPVEVLKLDAAEPARAPEGQDLQNAVDKVYPLYVEYRDAWRRLHEAILASTPGLGAPKAMLGSLFETRMPAVFQEEQFRALIGAPAAPSEASSGQRGLLQVFARTYAGDKQLTSDAELEGLLERLSGVLEAFATAFLELRKGQAEFGEGVAVRAVTSDSPLRRSKTPQELLHFLLDPSADADARIDDLTGGFGEVMIHQVAMLGATRRGVRALLERLDPAKIQAPLVWPARLWTRWHRFESAWNALADEEHAVRVVFGPEFSRSYAMVMGSHTAATGPGQQKAGRGSGKTQKP